MQTMAVSGLPEWVPEEACRYLEHTEAGRSIRNLAKQAGCHPSTVLRQVRRVETRRDDPLVDAALASLAACHYAGDMPGPQPMSARALALGTVPTCAEAFESEAVEVLTCLNPQGAVLAVADGLEKAVVVREAAAGDKKVVVDRTLAEALALRDWIACPAPGRLSRYHITPEGRSALSQFVASRENRARSRLESTSLATRKTNRNRRRPRRARYGLGETPLHMLARLTDRDGTPFLTTDLVRAGERLREDFELAQVAEHLAQTSAQAREGDCGPTMPRRRRPGQAASAAKKRAAAALNALGEGLSDIVMRCCCHLEGLEAAERQLGWSARSGKVVLRIALQQLKLHYDAQQAQDELIG
ncbi:DUF6456 domain-containing protein [Phaeobacter gallaeciensis]|uniref:DUF6456 domain-containing protein n=1 Tax=Phaeobacter gallaeciensis TaxID=60890 RepID=A0AAC9Z9D2_9RHOB|nr:DUF6456 domain-containing protein [Phaeobacter gallaeciensis]AHD09688.1 hypothetical protein Gal_01936 [Phaeobacter gallaeciensis DSM 26640]ATE92952.1 hypothetical protein PhaeoP11_01927 [Phaeobacter gallaeciensis]ATE97226.1 hypothetical protein PhaeoP73_01919 [Phaeobacter gallaeciensis]ATF01617.1 hypothetical protein PhaeoP75_01977 [Phaeobacter gallaeciensis]ATF05997.1 hypothetical protein PhaeoP63_01925 [Phaeobacter gallaeciensis]